MTTIPDFPIVDAHVHLWDPQQFRLPWLDDNPTLHKPFGLADYKAHTRGIEVGAFVYIEVAVAPAYGLLEARWVVDRANEDSRLKGIVAWAPLEDGERARSYLDALVAIDPQQRIKGIRRFPPEGSSPQQLGEGFVRGVQLLGEYGLSFDLNVGHEDLPLAIALAERCPKTAIVLNHIGGPDIVGKQRESWWSDIATMAQLSHVACKVSGAVTLADHEHWVVSDLAPYIERVIEVFGEDRVAYASDWPVMLLGSPYLRWVQALGEITATLSPTAKTKLWAENAKRLYRLKKD